MINILCWVDGTLSRSSRTGHRRTDRNTVTFLHANIHDFIEQSNWPSQLAASKSYGLDPIQFGALFSIWCVVRRSKTFPVDWNKSGTNSCWVVINQELINDAIDHSSKCLLLVIGSQNGHSEHLVPKFCDVCLLQLFLLCFALKTMPMMMFLKQIGTYLTRR